MRLVCVEVLGGAGSLWRGLRGGKDGTLDIHGIP